MASTSFALPNTNKILAISKSATLSSNNNDNNSNNKVKNKLQISSPTSFLPSIEDMKEKTIQNLKAAIEFKNMLHIIQRNVFEAYTRKFLVEFLETDDGKLAIRRIDKVIVPMSIKASSMADAPIVEDSSLKRTSKFPSYINKRVNTAREKLALMHENQLESLLMIQAEAKAQLQTGTSMVQLYTMSETVLHKVRGNVVGGSDLMDTAFYGSNNNNNEGLRVDLSDIISDARRQQQLFQEKLKRELVQMNILIRLSDERREKYHNFDADEDNSAKLYLGDNLAKDILPDGIIIKNQSRNIDNFVHDWQSNNDNRFIRRNKRNKSNEKKTSDSNDQVEEKNDTTLQLSNSPSNNNDSTTKNNDGRRRRKKKKRHSMILVSLKDEVKVDYSSTKKEHKKKYTNIRSAFKETLSGSAYNDEADTSETVEEEKIALELKIEYLNSVLLSLNRTRATDKKELEEVKRALSKWDGISTMNLPQSVVSMIEKDEKHKTMIKQKKLGLLRKTKKGDDKKPKNDDVGKSKSSKHKEHRADKGYTLSLNHNHTVHKHRKMLTPSKVIKIAKREMVTKNVAATIIQTQFRGIIARKYIRLVRARIQDATLQREIHGIQLRSVLKVVSKMRLFIKRRRVEKQKKIKHISNLVVAKVKVRNHRVITQKKLLQDISNGAAEKAREMRQAKHFLKNTDDNNHIETAIKQRRQSIALIKKSAALVAKRAAEITELKGSKKAIFMDAALGGKKREVRLKEIAEKKYLDTHKLMLKNAADHAKWKKKEADIAEKLSRLRNNLNSNSSRKSSWMPNTAPQAASLKDNSHTTLTKGTRVEVSLPCPGRSADAVLTGFIIQDDNGDPSIVTYGTVAELKIKFDDGLTSSVPKDLVRASTAPLPYLAQTRRKTPSIAAPLPPSTVQPKEYLILKAAIERIWHKYDINNSNSIDTKEAKQMMIDITGHKNVSENHVKTFIAHVENKAYKATGQKPNGTLKKNELLNFLEHGIHNNGIHMDEEQQEIYAKRGAFEKTLVDFCVGCEKLIHEIMGEHRDLLIKYIDSIWPKYDVDNSNSIRLTEVKQLILDVSGHDHVSEDECLDFIKYIKSQSSDNGNYNGEIEKEELLSFLEVTTSMSEDERKSFGSRSKFHATLADFINGVDKARHGFSNNSDAEEAKQMTMDITGHPPSIAAPLQLTQKSEPEKKKSWTKKSKGTLSKIRSAIRKSKKITGKIDPNDTNIVEKIFRSSFASKSKQAIDYKNRSISPFSKHLTEDELKKREESDRNSFIDRIWSKYDGDGNGDLDASEMKRLIDRFTGEKVSVINVEKFLKEIDQDGDALIQQEELREFVSFGLKLSKQDREDYAARGPLQKIIVKFFYGLDGAARIHAKEQRAIERQKIQEAGLMAQKEERLRQKRLVEIRRKKEAEKKEASKEKKSILRRLGRGVSLMKHKVTEDEIPLSEKDELERTEFINFVWKEYDKDGSGQIDANETKQLLQDFTGHEVSFEDVNDFLSSIDADGDALIQKGELIDFINTGMDLTESERTDYAARGSLHSTIVEFFYGVDTQRKQFMEQKRRAMKAAEADMDKILEDRRKRYREASARSKSPAAMRKRMDSRTPSPKTKGKGGAADVGDYVQIILPFLKFEINDKLVGIVLEVQSHGARTVRIDTAGLTGEIQSNEYTVPSEKLQVITEDEYDDEILLLPYIPKQSRLNRSSSRIDFGIQKQKTIVGSPPEESKKKQKNLKLRSNIRRRHF